VEFWLRWPAPPLSVDGCCAAPGPTTAGKVARAAAHDRLLAQALSQRFLVASLAAQWTSLGSVAAMLASPPGLLVLALLIAIAATFAAAQRLSPQPAGQEQPARALVRLLPVLPAVFGVVLPVAVLLYWLTTNLWILGQQYVLLRL